MPFKDLGGKGLSKGESPRPFAIIPLLLLIVLLSVPAWAASDGADIIERLNASLVTVTAYDDKDEILREGNGFFVFDRRGILTARHILQGASRVRVRTSDGRVYKVTGVIADDSEGDLIRIFADVPGRVGRGLRISRSRIREGEQIFVPPCLEEPVKELSSGVVASVLSIPSMGKVIQITAPVSEGSSGSPVLNEEGEVVGVVAFQVSVGQDMNFAVSPKRIMHEEPKEIEGFSEWLDKRDTTASSEELVSNGVLFASIGDYDKAVAYFEEAVKKDPSFAPAYFLMGYTNAAAGRYDDAINAYSRGMKFWPELAEWRYYMGLAYLGLGDHKAAVRSFSEAVSLDPDYDAAYLGLGKAYTRLKEYTKAIEAYRKGIGLRPERPYPDVHFDLGLLYLAVGRLDSAKREYEVLKKTDSALAARLMDLISR